MISVGMSSLWVAFEASKASISEQIFTIVTNLKEKQWEKSLFSLISGPLAWWEKFTITFDSAFKSFRSSLKSDNMRRSILKVSKIFPKCRSSCQEVFCKKCVLRIFANFTGKHLCQSLFFNKFAGLRPATLSKKRLWHRCFPVRFAKFLSAAFFTEHSGGCFWKWSLKFLTTPFFFLL